MYSHSIGELIHHWPQAGKGEDRYESEGKLEKPDGITWVH